MISRADQLKEQAKKLRQHATEPSAERATPAAPAVRTKTVRRTVDLTPGRHAALNTWCSETAQELGVARVTGQDVIRTLIARLLTDETLAKKVRHDLRAEVQ